MNYISIKVLNNTKWYIIECKLYGADSNCSTDLGTAFVLAEGFLNVFGGVLWALGAKRA